MPDVMARLERADPARGRQLPEPERIALLQRVAIEQVPARPPGRRQIPRRTLALAAVLALAVSGVGLATFDFGQAPDEVERDYNQVIKRIPLPPGYRWPGAQVEHDAVYAGRRAAVMQATIQADCAWWDHWLAAAAGGESATMARALDAEARVFAATPRAPNNGSEDAGGIDATTVAHHRTLVADAKAGRTQRIASYVAINCSNAIRRR